MSRLLAAVGALTLGITLVACGDTSRPAVDPDLAGKPTWGGCSERSTQISDYTADAKGAKTRAAAMARYRMPGDHVVFRGGHGHHRATWLLVDEKDVIHTSLELVPGASGWLVSTVEKCAS
jgi:hypothetical protein